MRVFRHLIFSLFPRVLWLVLNCLQLFCYMSSGHESPICLIQTSRMEFAGFFVFGNYYSKSFLKVIGQVDNTIALDEKCTPLD